MQTCEAYIMLKKSLPLWYETAFQNQITERLNCASSELGNILVFAGK